MQTLRFQVPKYEAYIQCIPGPQTTITILGTETIGTLQLDTLGREWASAFGDTSGTGVREKALQFLRHVRQILTLLFQDLCRQIAVLLACELILILFLTQVLQPGIGSPALLGLQGVVPCPGQD